MESVENYILPVRLTSFDIGATRKMKYSMILRLLQESAGRQLEKTGLGYSVLRETYGMVFLLVSAAVQIHRLPACGETVEAETWLSGIQGAKFLRSLRLRVDGEICAEVGSHWVLVDPDSHHVLRPARFQALKERPPKPGGPSPILVEKQRPGLLFGEHAIKDGVLHEGKRRVRYSDLDSNRHVNNAVYLDMLCDFFPGGFAGHAFSSIKIDLLREAKENEWIAIRACRKNEQVYYEGQIDGHPCFVATVQLAEK